MKSVIHLFILLYQKTISPDHGLAKALFPYGFCRFYPSCSEYVKDAVGQDGAIRGLARGAWRIIRCNPWNKGGVDKIM